MSGRECKAMALGEKHKELAVLGLTWLGNKVTRKGMRGTTEVALAQGYVADAVAMCSLQRRFLKDYLWNSILPDGEIQNYFACVFEAKANRSDFCKTFRTSIIHSRIDPIGSLHWCITPKRIVNHYELPSFWGLLEESGSGLREVKKPQIKIISGEQLDKIAHQLLWHLQARRNYICCKNCEKTIYEGYCGRCFISPRGE